MTPPDMTPEDDVAEIQETNARFYRAVESRDLDAMEAVWLHADYVRCVHPGWCLLTGWESVRQSWEAIFKDSAELRFTLSDIQIQVEGGLAWVTGTENIISQSEGNISVTAVLATNLFERQGPRWRMVLHHASHILTGDPEVAR
jgi:ketosteroid isomerase-like protein